MGVFVRRVKTASGATAVQIVHKRVRRVLSIEHIGLAHTDDELAVLLQVAGEPQCRQLALDLGGAGEGGAGTPAVVEGTASLILWEVLAGIYDDLGLDRLGDGTFRAEAVLARASCAGPSSRVRHPTGDQQTGPAVRGARKGPLASHQPPVLLPATPPRPSPSPQELEQRPSKPGPEDYDHGQGVRDQQLYSRSPVLRTFIPRNSRRDLAERRSSRPACAWRETRWPLSPSATPARRPARVTSKPRCK